MVLHPSHDTHDAMKKKQRRGKYTLFCLDTYSRQASCWHWLKCTLHWLEIKMVLIQMFQSLSISLYLMFGSISEVVGTVTIKFPSILLNENRFPTTFSIFLHTCASHVFYLSCVPQIQILSISYATVCCFLPYSCKHFAKLFIQGIRPWVCSCYSACHSSPPSTNFPLLSYV